MNTGTPTPLDGNHCSFCGRSIDVVGALFEGLCGASICQDDAYKALETFLLHPVVPKEDPAE